MAVELRDETKHFKLIGTTGSGKSTAIREVLRTALARGDRALIADPDGGYLQRFYDPDRGDVILNPFDPRSARWDLFSELRDPYDADQLARALIPDAADTSGREWRAYARTFLASILRPTGCAGALHQTARTSVAGILLASSSTPTGSTPSESAGCAGALSQSGRSPASNTPSPSSHDRRPTRSPNCGANSPLPPRRNYEGASPTPPLNPSWNPRTPACLNPSGR